MLPGVNVAPSPSNTTCFIYFCLFEKIRSMYAVTFLPVIHGTCWDSCYSWFAPVVHLHQVLLISLIMFHTAAYSHCCNKYTVSVFLISSIYTSIYVGTKLNMLSNKRNSEMFILILEQIINVHDKWIVIRIIK